LIPPIQLQNKFVAIAQNIQLQKQQIKQQLRQSEALFQTLLQKALTGWLK
jgi:type I restriction enzyme S subunit